MTCVVSNPVFLNVLQSLLQRGLARVIIYDRMLRSLPWWLAESSLSIHCCRPPFSSMIGLKTATFISFPTQGYPITKFIPISRTNLTRTGMLVTVCLSRYACRQRRPYAQPLPRSPPIASPETSNRVTHPRLAGRGRPRNGKEKKRKDDDSVIHQDPFLLKTCPLPSFSLSLEIPHLPPQLVGSLLPPLTCLEGVFMALLASVTPPALSKSIRPHLSWRDGAAIACPLRSW